MNPPLLAVESLSVQYPGAVAPAVHQASLSLARGEALGVVGASGSGKTTLAMAIMGLTPVASGRVIYDGQRIDHLSRRQRRPWAQRLQMVFQDVSGALNPRMTVAQSLSEPLRLHAPQLGRAARRARCAELMAQVGLDADQLDRHPHAFSGGQRQRIGIARALAVSPQCLILDEPVSALDVSVQAQILNLLKDLQSQLGLAYLFIAHDLAAVEFLCDTVAVMDGGRIVEHGAPSLVYANPTHPQTRRLVEAVPRL